MFIIKENEREYRIGDSLRQMDWKATARTRKLIARDYQDERNQTVLFLLDCGRRMRAQDDELSHFDHALNAMILLAYVSWILRRRNTLLTMIPSAITAVAVLFCPEVYIRYLLPTMASLPLWLAAFFLLPENRAAPCQSQASVL